MRRISFFLGFVLTALLSVPVQAAYNPSTFAAPPAAAVTPYPILYNIPIQGGGSGSDVTGAIIIASALAPTNGQLYFGGGAFKIASNITISRPIAIAYGATLQPASGVTVIVTAPGSIAAGPYQICDTSQGGSCNFSGISQPSYVEWWGAVGGDTDYVSGKASANTTAWTASLANTSPILYALNKGYSITGLVLDASLPRTIIGAANQKYTTLIGSGIPYIYAADNPPLVSFNASQSGTTLTVNSVASGTLKPGQPLVDITGDLAAYTYITAYGSGTGGTGTYTVSQTASVSSEAMTVENPCGSHNIVLQNGAEGGAFEQQLENFGVTANSPNVIAVAVCGDNEATHPAANWQIQATNSFFGHPLASNSSGPYAGWIWQWGNVNDMTSDLFYGDMYGEGFLGGNVSGSGENTLQKIRHDGGQWSCNNPTSHGFLIYQDFQGGGLLSNNSWNGGSLEACQNLYILDGIAQVFNGAPWMERINFSGGGLLWEAPTAGSIWTQPGANFALSGPFIEKLSTRSEVNLGSASGGDYISASGQVGVFTGVGSPNSNVFAGRGSVYYRTDASGISQSPCFQMNSSPASTGWVNSAGSSC